jgi:hypothetical protein
VLHDCDDHQLVVIKTNCGLDDGDLQSAAGISAWGQLLDWADPDEVLLGVGDHCITLIDEGVPELRVCGKFFKCCAGDDVVNGLATAEMHDQDKETLKVVILLLVYSDEDQIFYSSMPI